MSETVYLKALGTGGGQRIIHTNKDCPHLNKARKIHEYPRSSYPDTPVCEYCSGEYTGAETSDPDYSHYNALIAAANGGGST